ncbi:AAA family ATPase [Mycobacterium stomatepiae]|uniref:Uncharacterized protein n=1 Tax=Mycobacterium stomatepiae TaxID=470076 RepID=A0A7I7Q5L7_9MYCO|nr:AAA family ATPase [Mycobacterium stomatepiae]MCV7163290.1 AAA family ATPase [Mycobacterium stomatepiae]BBY21306.1 hypothetical protein MSTO_15110 [Mycobacterium stomatepiae]
MHDLYVDVAALLAGGLSAPEPDVLQFSDDFSLFYSGEFNLIFGDTESGKTWLCLAAVASMLAEGGRASVIDLDHNGAESIVTNLINLGVDLDILTDTSRFRLAEPHDSLSLKQVVGDQLVFKPDVVTIDSLGEVLPLFKYNSNSADDFTVVHTEVIKPLTREGAAVLVVDHLAKNADSRAHGPTGTMAKTRAVGGLAVRVTAEKQFRPGEGGTAKLELHKDRHGGIRKHYPTGQIKPVIGTFELLAKDDNKLGYNFRGGLVTTTRKQKADDVRQLAEDLAMLRAHRVTRPTVREARNTLGSSNRRAQRAVSRWDDEGLVARGREIGHSGLVKGIDPRIKKQALEEACAL